MYFKSEEICDREVRYYNAVKEGNVQVASNLLKHCGQYFLGEDDGCSILFAAENGHVEMVKLLLENEQISSHSELPNHVSAAILVASEGGHTEVVKFLLADDRIADKWKKKALNTLNDKNPSGFKSIANQIFSGIKPIYIGFTEKNNLSFFNSLPKDLIEIIMQTYIDKSMKGLCEKTLTI